MGHKSEDRFITSSVQDILHTAHKLKEVTALSHSFSHSFIAPGNFAIEVDLVNLPNPRPLLPSLLEAGFGREIATEISKTYQRRAEELRGRIQESVIATCHGIAGLPVVKLGSSPDLLVRKVASTFTELYLRRLEQWKGEIVQRTRQASKSSASMVAPRSARTFNYEYVPSLELFFEENAFPTHADKVFLAKKSNMEYRQIHVWFQNRRNRSKKEGKPLRKKPTYESATNPLGKLYNRMKDHMVNSDAQVLRPPKVSSPERMGEIEPMQHKVSNDAFVSTSPPHAFPSYYPPTCRYDPFPCKSGPVSFGKPKWRRVPDGKRSLSISSSIDDLIARFSHLNVRDGTRPKGSPKLQSHAATVAITTIPSRAPHPSLVVRKYPQPTNVLQLPPLVCAPVSGSKAFQSPSPNSAPVTLVPPSNPSDRNEFPRKRKTASLPRRIPGQMRNTRRDTTPSESSSTSSSSPRLFSADTESRSCSFSSASSLSMPSDAASIQELPYLFGSSCRSPLDSPIHLRGLGDMVAISPSPVS